MLLISFHVKKNCISVDCAAPAELTLDVNLKAGFDEVEVYIGGMTKMEVKVAFPVGTTSAVSIELLPSTNVTIMALGQITVTDASTTYVTKTGSSLIVRHITDETLGVSFINIFQILFRKNRTFIVTVFATLL